MKTRFTWLAIIAACILGISAAFIGCENDVNAIVQYEGKVVHKGTTTPFPDLEVKITNGDKIHTADHTDTNGNFTLNVRVNEIDGSYYVLVGDSSCVTKRMELSGYGQAKVNLGTIEIEGPSLPTVSTKTIFDISDSKATTGGNVTADGRSFVTARGVCWSMSEYPTIDDEHTQNGSGMGEFKSQITNIEAGTTYYVRAYATNRVGTAYGEQLTLSTKTGLPQVTTDEVNDISATTAICGGDVADNSGYPITARGVCWSDKTATPTINNEHTEEVATTGHFTSLMIGLERNTTYYVRAYAVNEKGTNYGETKIFTTLSGLPTVTTSDISEIKASSAKGGGNVTSNGGYTITARGICWSSTSSTPTVDDAHTSEVADNGAFTSLMTGLSANTTYYVRAYATNEAGTSYGESVSFTTSSGVPSVSTAMVSEIKAATAKSGGTIISDGGYTITACGVCWSTNSATPVISDKHTSEITNNNSFVSQLIDLSPNTIYYVRAYATNEYGTSYGESISFTTADGLPSVTTTVIGENVTESTAISGGHVTDDGGSTVTARGVCWSTLPYPTISDNKTTDGSGTGYYSSTITGIDLSSNTIYYVRAYATNQNGTSYGAQVLVSKENRDYKNLPSVKYAGYTYRIYSDIGAMTWEAANEACENLVYGGYDDWRMPTKEEGQAILSWYNITLDKDYYYTQYHSPGFSSIWTSTLSGTAAHGCYVMYYTASRSEYTWYYASGVKNSEIYNVIAVRRYIK